MKIEEFLTEEELDEINLKKAGTATALAMALANPLVLNPSNPNQPNDTSSKSSKDSDWDDYVANEVNSEKTAQKISRRYNIPLWTAYNIVQLAKKHQKPGFPRADDLLAIAGIESSFKPESVSGLKKDPAVGLTQVRPKMWKQDPKQFKADIEQQIKVGSDILAKYNSKLDNPIDAVHAYNIGLAAFQRGDQNQSYVDKFKKEKEFYK